MKQIEDRRPGAADVKEPGGRRSEAQFHGAVHRARESSTTRPTERGLTLVEVLVATLILALVAMTSVAAFTGRRRHLQQAHETTLAYQALSNEAEFRRRVPYDNLDDAPAAFISDTALLQPLAPFSAVTRVDDVRPGRRNVTMTVRWERGTAQLVVMRADTGGSSLW